MSELRGKRELIATTILQAIPHIFASSNHGGISLEIADAILALFEDTIKDAERWRMIPAFLEDHQLNYIRLLSQVDAAIDAAKGAE